MTERESVIRTLGVTGGVAVFCSLLVSTAVLWLRPIQLAYQSIERNRAVLEAAGLAEPGGTLGEREVVDRFLELEVRVVDLDAGSFSNAVPAATYDFRAALNDPEQSVPVPAALDLASLGRRPLYMPAYLVRDGARIRKIVLPVYGQGMWSTIHGFVSLRGDFTTIDGLAVYEHGETPGIGDRVLNPEWLGQWRGLRAYGRSGELVLRMNDPDATTNAGIDAVTGATVTASAVERLLRYWLGDDGFGPFLAAMRRQAG